MFSAGQRTEKGRFAWHSVSEYPELRAFVLECTIDRIEDWGGGLGSFVARLSASERKRR